MKLAFIHLCGFRGYRKPVRIEFSDSFTIIDGRNGAGKSTVFDAVEFALTGTISKYLDAKSARESVQDYLWWTGQGDTVSDRFVEVGFRDGEDCISIRRTPLDAEVKDTGSLFTRLVEPEFAPKEPMAQLCSSTIIRDEHIARLSLDLKEGDRFALLRDAIGAVDAEDWIKRAQALTSLATSRVKSMATESEQAAQSMANAARQIDQARAALPEKSLINQAATRLQSSLRTSAAADQLPDIARRRMAEIATQLDRLRPLAGRFERTALVRATIPALAEKVESASATQLLAQITLDEASSAAAVAPASTALGERARMLVTLVDLGRNLERREGHCPLCESAVSHEQFQEGLEAALTLATSLDAQAVEQSAKEKAQNAASATLAIAEEAHRIAKNALNATKTEVAEFDERLAEFALDGEGIESIERHLSLLEIEQQAIGGDLRLIDTVSLDRAISRATSDQDEAKKRIAAVEARLGRARLAESRAKAIFDATRRAAAETLDQRLDRVLPLMSELYKRLRPHPIWSDIEYSVRGDVQRFLRLQVGGDINPQFVFSSGQRRATGLAFLLSVNLSITWSRWNSILLDDPVQHVDDFRTVHLAEVLSHLCASGRQIICAVEDSALADLMCRRLPMGEGVPGKRVSLGTDSDGALAVINEKEIAPLSRRALVIGDRSLSA